MEGLPELLRSGRLRRADWRFLLPEISPHRALCVADTALTEAVGAISDEVSDAPGGQPHDLAVLQNPSPALLQASLMALKPGGNLYLEWTSRRPGPRTESLRAAGLERIERFWPWPSLGHPKAWLPVDAPQAMEHFLSMQPAPDSARGHLARLAYRALLAARRHAWISRPVCLIARRTGRLAPPAPLEHIRAGWEEWGAGPRPRRLDWLLLTGGARSENKVVALVFADGAKTPRLVVKMARLGLAADALRAEADCLQHSPPQGMPGVPSLLFWGDLAGRPMLIESALDGRPVFDHLQPATLRANALRATDWLAALAGQPAPTPRAEWWGRLAAPVLDDFERNFRAVASPQRLAATHALLATLDALPLVCEHRDFEPWNVRQAADGSLVVLDWETAEPQGLPAMDLIYFLTYLALSLGGALDSAEATRTVYRQLLDAGTAPGKLFAECLARYAERVGLDPAALRPLRRLTWLLHCRWEFQDLARDAGIAPSKDQIRRSLFLRLWEEDCDAA